MLVKAYVRVSMFDEAIDALFQTRRQGFVPHIVSCNFLMNQQQSGQLMPLLMQQSFVGRKFGAAEDMSKEDIAANRAIGLYGVSFLQSHIKDSKSLRSLTHCNTRSLVTTAKFHLIHYNLLAYRISRGSIQLVDLRQSAVYDHKAEGGAEVSSMGSPFKEKFDPQKAMALGLKAGQNTVNYSL
ncbi:hypothetical protein AAG906_028686 [Vitis piasezkii]